MSANVLLVDDSPVIRRMTREQLERLGVEVREAGDAQGALRALQQRVPDLVCVDLMLPEVSGYELCERIRADPALSRVPVLVISARCAPTDRAHALEAGANAFLTKPFRMAELAAAVTALLRPGPGQPSP
jgi:two-component system chemotaxis response regulator CheY